MNNIEEQVKIITDAVHNLAALGVCVHNVNTQYHEDRSTVGKIVVVEHVSVDLQVGSGGS